jgi:glutamate-1-semialdehyde aminotransferase
MHYSATFHGDSMAMAACLATLRIASAEHTREHCENLGIRLIAGLNELATELSVSARAYGEPLGAMPFFRFTYSDRGQNELMTQLFFREVLARGVLLHPRHLWFICGAHTPQHIEHTLHVCRSALTTTLALMPAR